MRQLKKERNKNPLEFVKLIKATGIFSIVFGAWSYGKDVLNLFNVIMNNSEVIGNYLYGITALLLLITSVGGGIGLILYKKWGWFACLFTYVYLSISNIVSMASLLTVLDEISQFYMLYIIQNILHMVIGVLVVFYLLTDEVVDAFGVDQHKQKGYALMAMIASVLITSLINLMTYKMYLG